MVEMHNLLAQDEILQQRWSPWTSPQAGLFFDRPAGVRCHERVGIVHSELPYELLVVRHCGGILRGGGGGLSGTEGCWVGAAVHEWADG